MNRIEKRFADLRAAGQKGFIAYIAAGDPNLAATEQVALALSGAGVDILELGVPFSDPLADGLVNQLAAQRGLASGTTPNGVFDCVAAIRRASEIPIVLYVYYNLIHQRGLESFVRDAAAAGVDGVLALDLPPEEAADYQRVMASHSLCAIWLIAPTTPEERVQTIARLGSGFLYYVSREGVTGMQATLSAGIAPMLSCIRRHSTLPVAVGFGISNAEQARAVAAHGEAVVVGSAIVNEMAQMGQDAALPQRIAAFVNPLVSAVRN